MGKEAPRPESSQEGRTEDTQGTGLEAREASGKRKGPRAWKRKAGVLRASHLRGITSCVPPPLTHAHQARGGSANPFLTRTSLLFQSS